jgi:hypothetical protein
LRQYNTSCLPHEPEVIGHEEEKTYGHDDDVYREEKGQRIGSNLFATQDYHLKPWS